jgi:hypothetical protein
VFGKKFNSRKGVITFTKEAKGIMDLAAQIFDLLNALREKGYFEFAYFNIRS